MNWTTDPPTEEGWYWFHMDTGDQRPVIVYVISADRMVAIGTERVDNPAPPERHLVWAQRTAAFRGTESQP